MELDDLSFSEVLNKKRLFDTKWKELTNELIRERDASKSSLEKANLKIVELETTLAMYKAKESMFENEKLILSQAINTLHQELRNEDFVSKKFNEVEQSVSELNKAVEKLTSELEKTANSSKDVNNSTSKAKTKCFEEIHIDNDQEALIKSKENEQIACEDDIECHVIDVMLSDDELPPEHYDDEASEPSLLEPKLKQKTGSLRNSTDNKSDNCDEVPLTDVTASSSQLLPNRNEKINQSHSFTNEKIPSPTTAKSSDITDVLVESNEDLADRNTEIIDTSAPLQPKSLKILLEKLVDVQEGVGKKFVTGSGKNSDVDTKIPSSSLRYNVKKKNAVRLRNKTYFRDVENAVSNSIDSCSASGRPSSQSSVKPQNSTRVKTTHRKLGKPYCVMDKKNNPSNPVPRFTILRPGTDLYRDVFKNHPKPYSICYLCPYADGNCRSVFRSMDHLRSHVKLFHQEEKQQLHPCNYCDESFEDFFELKNHTEQKHG
ncbi:uncharacterized protein LOC135835668 [Planococcus citri]|uniref:uncharacterized protein LOC135835668 n=1 Tax=Planococcus citri TaxID=170843 RepID=UPI0031F9D8B0